MLTGVIMKYQIRVSARPSATLSVSALLLVLLSASNGIAQSRISSEAGRGYPFSSGENWSACLGIGGVLAVLGIIIAIANAVKDVVADEHWWHLIILAVATFLGGLGLTDLLARNSEYPVEPGTAFLMFIPSFIVVGILYLVIMKSVQTRRDRR
jgi:hypothetical protein